MTSFLRFCLLWVLLPWLSVSAKTSPKIPLDPQKDVINIVPQAKYFEDTSGKLRFRDILRKKKRRRV